MSQLHEKTHADLWDRIGNLEIDVTALTERLDSTRELVLQNQEEFRTRITNIESTLGRNTVTITRIDEKISTGTKLLAWLFTAGIAAMGLGLGIIGYLAT